MKNRKKVLALVLFFAMLISAILCVSIIASAEDATESTFEVNAASVRLVNEKYDAGIRFRIIVPDSIHDDPNFEHAGACMIPAKLLGDEKISTSTNDKIATATSATWTDLGNGTWEGVVYVYNIPSSNYGTDLVIAAYATVGGTTQYSEVEKTFTLAEVAKATAALEGSNIDALKDYFTFNVNVDGTASSYEYGALLTAPTLDEGEVCSTWTNTAETATWNFATNTVTSNTTLIKGETKTSHDFDMMNLICKNCGYQAVAIANAADFAKIKDDLNGYYVLTADITLPDVTDYIVSQTTEFTGTLDGNGHTLTYNIVKRNTNNDGGDNQSLFGIIGVTGVIKNLAFKVDMQGTVDNTTRGMYNRAAIAYQNKGLIENVFVDVTFSDTGASGNGNRSAGMVIVNDGTINNCLVEITYTSTNSLWRTDNASYTGNGQHCRLYAVCDTGSGTISNTGYVAHYDSASDGKIYLRNNDATTSVSNVYPLNRHSTWTADPTVANLLSNWDTFVSGGFEIGTLWAKTADGVIFNGKLIMGGHNMSNVMGGEISVGGNIVQECTNPGCDHTEVLYQITDGSQDEWTPIY